MLEINMAYGRGMLYALEAKQGDEKFRRITKTAYKDQFAQGVFDGRRCCQWSPVWSE